MSIPIDPETTAALLHFDESVTKDECGNTWTVYGNPTISDSNAKFGKALQLDGSSYLELENPIYLGGQDFTIAGWCYTDPNNAEDARAFEIYRTSGKNKYTLVNLRHPAGSRNWRLSYSWRTAVNVTGPNISDSGVNPTGELHHFAVVYQYTAKYIYFFVDGVRKVRTAYSLPQYDRQLFNVRLGCSAENAGYYFTGALDEFVIIDGLALWTADFTPPTEPYSLPVAVDVELLADTSRKVSNILLVTADTKRILSSSVDLTVDTKREISKTIDLTADTKREISKSVEISADTRRNLTQLVEVNADTVRVVRKAEELLVEVTADTKRNVKNLITTEADTLRNVQKTIEVNADTERVVSNTAIMVDLTVDTQRKVSNTVEVSADTLLKVTKSVEITADTSRKVVAIVDLKCDTARALPFQIINTPLYMPGLKSVNIDLQEQTITDQISYTLASNNAADFANIGDVVKGQYYNYNFSQKVDETEQRGIVQTSSCEVDIDAILYTPIKYDISSSSSGAMASGSGNSSQSASTGSNDTTEYKSTKTHIETIANKIGKKLIYLAKDYTSTMALEQENVTYGDLISELFGWTSRIPQAMINCFFRGDTLYVVQRGYEPNTIDLTNTKHPLPTIKRELERVTWGSEADSKTTVTRKVGGLTFIYDDWVETLDDESGHTVLSYRNNVLSRKTFTGKDGSSSVTDYYYNVNTSGTRFLEREVEVMTDADGNTTTHETRHTSLGQGQRLTTLTVDGAFVSSSVGNTSGDDSATTFIQKRNEIFAAQEKTGTRTIEGNPLIDPSFPLAKDSELEEVTGMLKWLNRRIRETVTMEVHKFDHVVDFLDAVTFEGNTYYLQTNSIEAHERLENKQTLSLVRWY